jgi:hypothetical protein
LTLLPFTVTMVKGARKAASTKGELLYTEIIPPKLRPRKVLQGNRWSMLENLGRVATVVVIGYIIYLALTTDLTQTGNMLNIVFGAVAAVLMIYVTEVISPRGRRMSYPVRVWSKGLEVHTSLLERARGLPSFVPKEMISKLIVRRIEVSVDGKMEPMPTNLKLRLTNDKVLDLGRRNYYELDKIIRTMKEKYGVRE